MPQPAPHHAPLASLPRQTLSAWAQEAQGGGAEWVLCATARLALELQNEWLRLAGESAEGLVEALPCQTFAQWAGQMRDELLLAGVAEPEALFTPTLSAVEERLIWEDVVAQDLRQEAQGLSDFFDHVALAQSAQQAHVLSVVWGVAAPADAAEVSEEAWRFAQWQQAFQQRCQVLGRLDSARSQAAVLQAWLQHPVATPQRVALAGYVRLDPQESTVLRHLRAQGVDIVALGPDHAPATPSLCSFPDATAERWAAALWARDQLQAHPSARLAIVVPDLGAQREAWADTLDDLLAPHTARSERADALRPYNLSLGTPLARSPLVALALALMNLLSRAHKVALQDWSALLRDPLWSAPEESAQRALLDAELRRQHPPHASLGHWLAVSLGRLSVPEPAPDAGSGADPVRIWPAPITARHLQALQEALASARRPQRPSVWSQQLRPLLQRCGWLAGRRPDSLLYQTDLAFQSVVQSMAALDRLLGAIPLSRYAQELRRQCSERIFQAETPQAPRLQVLGLLEAAGLHFDAVWAVGLTDQLWPPPARPNPLLGIGAQRMARVPNASADVQREFAQAVQSALLETAPQVTLSWPRAQGDALLRPSALLGDLAGAPALPAPPPATWWHQAWASNESDPPV